MQKLYDLAAASSSYTVNGEVKKRWKTVGALMDDGKGGQFIFIDPTINFAAFPRKDGSESVLISLFKPKGSNDAQPSQPQEQPQAQGVENVPF